MNKNGPKKAQGHQWKKTHLVKGFSALFTAIRTVALQPAELAGQPLKLDKLRHRRDN